MEIEKILGKRREVKRLIEELRVGDGEGEDEDVEEVWWGRTSALNTPRQLFIHSVLDSQIDTDQTYRSYLPSYHNVCITYDHFLACLPPSNAKIRACLPYVQPCHPIIALK